MMTVTDPVSKDAIRDFIQSNLIAGQSIEMDSDLLLSGLIDSLGIMTLVAHLETASGKPVPLEDIVL